MKKDHTKKDNQDNSKKNVKKIKVAVFCIAAILIFYLGTNFLKGIDVFGRKSYYYAVFNNAGGLQESNPVSINGYKVGKVTHVKLISNNPIKICAEILITEELEVPIDSKFEVAPKDLLGGTVVNLILGTSPTYAASGDTLACYVVPPVTNGLDDMKSKLNNILASVDTIGTSLKEVIKLDGAQDLQQILSNIEQSTTHLNTILAQNKFKVGEIVSNFETFSQT
ncbi:MAG: MlaD family protein, partial [Bacteroidales bacterium]